MFPCVNTKKQPVKYTRIEKRLLIQKKFVVLQFEKSSLGTLSFYSDTIEQRPIKFVKLGTKVTGVIEGESPLFICSYSIL